MLGAQEGVSHRDQAYMMVPSQPLATVVMIQTQYFFQFAVILFDPPARLGRTHGLLPSRWPAPLDHPVLRSFVRLGPFYKQPFLHLRGIGLFAPAVGSPDQQQGETGVLRPSTALPPSHRAPRLGRQLLGALLEAFLS